MTAAATTSDKDWLRHLIPHFIQQTKDRLTHIEAHRQIIYDGGDAVAAMKAISDVAHKISGTADTFGFADLGIFARTVENVWSTGSQHTKDPMITWSRMERELSSLIREITKLLASLTRQDVGRV